MRVVLDANVLISAVIQAGPSYRIVSRWLDESDLDVVICPAVLGEVGEVLGRPRLQRRIEPGLADIYLATIRRIANLVDDPVSIATATRDPDDDYLVALARQHDADYIVTGDKDLLEWDDQVPPAITPAAFEVVLSAR
ncbi:MAG: putative toxin-antitoxin system toxin component, PIN family [Ilumatobacteraceae bacterium]